MFALLSRRLIRALIRWRWPLLAVAAVLGAGAAFMGSRLSLDRSIEKMFAPDDPILEPYRRLQRTFGEHEIVLAVYEEPELTSESGLARIEELVAALRDVPGVVAVVSLLDPPGASDFEDEGRGALFRKMFVGYTHNAALDAAGVICLIEREGVGETPRRETLARMRKIISARPSGVLVGEPILVEEAFDLLELDGKRLSTWCLVLVLAVILLCFRRLAWLALPLATVWLTLQLTRGLLVLADLQMSMVSSMLGAIVTVVAVAAVVHVMVRYQEARRRGWSPDRAMLHTAEQLAVPVAFACLTDAAGFAALMISSVGPVHDFGLMMAIGSLLVLPSIMLVAPSLTVAGGVRDEVASGSPPLQEGDRDRSADVAANQVGAPQAESLPRSLVSRTGGVPRRSMLSAGLQRVLAWSTGHGTTLATVGVVLAIVAVLGARRLTLETDFTRNFREESSIVRTYDFVEKRFGGAGVWDLMVPVPPGAGQAEFAELLETQSRLKAQAPQLTKAISLADSLAAGLGGADKVERAFPFAVTAALRLLRARMIDFVEAIDNVDPETDQRWLRVMLRAPEQLPAQEKTALIEQVQATARESYPEAEVTGYYVLLTNLIESLLADQWTTFGVAAVAVVVMLAVAFRSVPLALMVMIPNTLPVLVLFGAMGWLGVRVNMGAAMIAAVSVGLSVDGSIHYVMLYQRLRRRGATVGEALAGAQNTVGRAATFATLALVAGFATLAVSDFVPTVYFGVLVSLSMIGGLAGNLTALPMMIAWYEGDRQSASHPPAEAGGAT